MIKILWEFPHNGRTWVEWIKDGKTKIRKFTQKQYEAFMAEHFSVNEQKEVGINVTN